VRDADSPLPLFSEGSGRQQFFVGTRPGIHVTVVRARRRRVPTTPFPNQNDRRQVELAPLAAGRRRRRSRLARRMNARLPIHTGGRARGGCRAQVNDWSEPATNAGVCAAGWARA
jgi:hypothetical protein